MSWHSQVVLAAWGLLGLAMVWAHVADAVERRRKHGLPSLRTRVRLVFDVRASGRFGRR